MERDPTQKVGATQALFSNFLSSENLDFSLQQVVSVPVPGRPDKPLLVHPSAVVKRRPGTFEGRLAQFHAFAHIEFNAINLALDAVYRFAGMPHEYYRDWLQVAAEEAHHFTLICEYLNHRDTHYGDYTAHDNLWQMALQTEHDVLLRMALVPRVLEARGLDVTPKIVARLKSLGDTDAVRILNTIYEDEIGHVEIGNRWYMYACDQRELEPIQTFKKILKEHARGYLSGPFNHDARAEAGFSETELRLLNELSAEIKTAS
ncbi:MAG: ferritin-like domain-containing protein [Pseudomonadota bacterium]